MFDTHKPIHLETDASDLAIGACLTQEHDGKRHPVAYYSRKMSTAEQNYDIHDKELLAIVASLEHWRVYAEGAPALKIWSDHKNLLHFSTTKVLNRRQVRWSELLGQYKFEIQYTPGSENGRADALSRRCDYMEGKDIVEHSILKKNKDGSLSSNVCEFNAMFEIRNDEDEQFPINQGKYAVSPKDEQECIRKHHDDPTNGHPGVTRTLERIKRHFTFPKIREKVEQYIKKCTTCQQDKSSRHAKYGKLQFRPPPENPWDEVTMDFINKLPPSRDITTDTDYNGILVMVDRLTKYSHFVPYNEEFNAEKLARLVLDRLIRYHGIPKVFITDRDKLFTSNHWKTLVNTIGIRHKKRNENRRHQSH